MPTLVIYYLRDLLLVNLLWAWIYNVYDLLRWLDVKQKCKIKDQNTICMNCFRERSCYMYSGGGIFDDIKFNGECRPQNISQVYTRPLSRCRKPYLVVPSWKKYTYIKKADACWQRRLHCTYCMQFVLNKMFVYW